MNDDPDELVSSLPSDENCFKKLKEVKTFEPKLDLLSTAAKHCKKEICKVLIEKFNFGNLSKYKINFNNNLKIKHKLDPNQISNGSAPLHWLVKSNFISALDTQALTNKFDRPELVLKNYIIF